MYIRQNVKKRNKTLLKSVLKRETKLKFELVTQEKLTAEKIKSKRRK